MLCSYLARLEKLFVEQGGIKERIYAPEQATERRKMPYSKAYKRRMSS